MELPDTACTILHTLLDRYEQPGRRQVVRVRLAPHEHPDYFSAEDSAPRHATNEALNQLAENGVLRLRWRKWEQGNWLDAVDLVAEQSTSLYTLIGRSPRNEQDQALRLLLDAQQPRPGWHASFLAWAYAQLELHHALAPLDRDDPRLNADLLRALVGLAELSSPTLERTLSIRLFGDSKRLEALRGAILRVLRRHDPAALAFGDDDWALLQAHNLVRAPEYVPIAGPLSLRMASSQPNGHTLVIDLTPFQPSVALSSAMLQTIASVAHEARCLLTVENATSFNELLMVRPPDVLTIYSGGFASPTVIRLLRTIAAARPDLPVLHWGDLDAGGLRILAHLRQQIGDVTAFMMGPEVFDAYQSFAQPLTPADRLALATLREHPSLVDCVPLIDRLLDTGRKLEQEAVETTVVLRHLASAHH